MVGNKLCKLIDISLFHSVVTLNKRDEDFVNAVSHLSCRYGVSKDRHIEVSSQQRIFPRLVELI